MSANSIEAALQRWAKSPEGQKALNNKVIEMYRSGDFKALGAGGAAVHEPQFYAEEMIRFLNQEFAAYGYDFGDYLYWYSNGWNDSLGGYEIVVNFKQEELDRPSLKPEWFPEGVYNIVALLNKGYHAANYVRGEWHGQSVRSLKDRAGLWYIQTAVEKFNSLYGAETNVDFDDIYGWRL